MLEDRLDYFSVISSENAFTKSLLYNKKTK